MSNDKEIRIRAVLDASTFDKGVNEIQEKLKKLTQQQSQGAGTQKQLQFNHLGIGNQVGGCAGLRHAGVLRQTRSPPWLVWLGT